MSDLAVALPDVPAMVAAMDAAAERVRFVRIFSRTESRRVDRRRISDDERGPPSGAAVEHTTVWWEEGQEPPIPPDADATHPELSRVDAILGSERVGVPISTPERPEGQALRVVVAVRARKLGAVVGHVEDVIAALPYGDGLRVLAELRSQLPRGIDWREARLVLRPHERTGAEWTLEHGSWAARVMA